MKTRRGGKIAGGSVGAALIAGMLFASPLYAVSGIGVAVRSVNSTPTLRLYKVTNTHIDTSYDIYSGNGLQVLWNNASAIAINTHGTHVAFYREFGATAAPDHRITVMRLSNPSKFVDVVSYGKDTTDYNGLYLAWPQGDWIYFTTAVRNKYLYRVNVQTRAIEFVAYINLNATNDPIGNYGADFKMSAVNYRISMAGGLYFTLQEAQAAPNGLIKTGQWPNGAFTIQGCGHTISPSGNVMGNQVDPGHCVRIVSTLNWQTRAIVRSVNYSTKARNNMSVDKKDPVLACSLRVDPSNGSDSGLVESIGVGSATYGNTFSVNSDKWEILKSGWAPDGREQFNGGNAVLWSCTDGIALNLTRLPRRVNGTEKPEPQCHVDPDWYFAPASAFFVTAPVGDIVPELQADATSDYRVPGLDDNTQFPALTMMPRTPPGGWPVVPVGVGAPHARSAIDTRSAAIGIVCGPSSLRIDIGAAGRPYSVAVFDARGSLLVRRCGTGGTEIFTSRDGIRPGVHLVRVERQGAGRYVSRAVER